MPSASIGMEGLFCLFSGLLSYVYTSFIDCICVIHILVQHICLRKFWERCDLFVVTLALDNNFLTNYRQYYLLSNTYSLTITPPASALHCSNSKQLHYHSIAYRNHKLPQPGHCSTPHRQSILLKTNKTTHTYSDGLQCMALQIKSHLFDIWNLNYWELSRYKSWFRLLFHLLKEGKKWNIVKLNVIQKYLIFTKMYSGFMCIYSITHTGLLD